MEEFVKKNAVLIVGGIIGLVVVWYLVSSSGGSSAAAAPPQPVYLPPQSAGNVAGNKLALAQLEAQRFAVAKQSAVALLNARNQLPISTIAQATKAATSAQRGAAGMSTSAFTGMSNAYDALGAATNPIALDNLASHGAAPYPPIPGVSFPPAPPAPGAINPLNSMLTLGMLGTGPFAGSFGGGLFGGGGLSGGGGLFGGAPYLPGGSFFYPTGGAGSAFGIA